jgi:hypothetical protein
MLTREAPITIGVQRENYLQKMMAKKSRTLMTSGSNEPVADGGGGGHSVFANALLKGLRETNQIQFTARELFTLSVQQQVAGSANQTPRYDDLFPAPDTGDFVFVKGKTDGKTGRGDVAGAPPVAKPAPDSSSTEPPLADAMATAKAKAELRDRGIGMDVTTVKNALMAVDLDVLKLLTAASIQPILIEEALRQKVDSDKVTVARRFFENSKNSPEAMKWFSSALAGGVNPNFLLSTGDYYEREGVLTEAVRSGNVAAVKALLEHGASPHAYQELFLTRYPLMRFLFPLRYLADDENLDQEQKQALVKLFIGAGAVVPRVIEPGSMGWPSVMHQAKGLRDEDAAKLGMTLTPSIPFCAQAENPICKHAGGDWCAALRAMPNKLKFDYSKMPGGATLPLFDITLVYLLNIEGNKAYFLGLTKAWSYEYVLVEVSKDASSWTVLDYMDQAAGMGLCKQDADDNGRSDYCWRRVPIRRVAGTDEMRFAGYGLSWQLTKEDCASIFPKDQK